MPKVQAKCVVVYLYEMGSSTLSHDDVILQRDRYAGIWCACTAVQYFLSAPLYIVMLIKTFEGHCQSRTGQVYNFFVGLICFALFSW